MELSQIAKEFRTIVLGFGLSIPLVIGIPLGLGYSNLKNQVKRFYPLIEHNLTLTKEAVKERRYEEARQLTEQTISLWTDFDLQSGDYQIFLKKGREINIMYRESCKIKKSLESLRRLEEIQ